MHVATAHLVCRDTADPTRVLTGAASVLRERFAIEHATIQVEPAGARSLVEVVAALGGVHAQVMSSAELALAARIARLGRQAVSKALWERRTLVKTWAMRGTLHLLAASELGVWHAALGTYRHWQRPSWARGFGITPQQRDALLDERYPAVLEDEHGELVVRVPERAPRREREQHRLVARLRDAGFEVGEHERAWLERQLQTAVRERVPVRLTLMTATDPVDIELVPLAVANGRLRARDANRDVERTLPLSAITKVAGLGAAR